MSGITWYACETGYWTSPTEQSTFYLILIGILPVLAGETIYLHLTTDADDFAVVESVAGQKPSGSQHFLKTEVIYYYSGRVRVSYPFDRYYMEESKAYDAELANQESQADTSAVAYALVSIKDGKSVLKDVLIDGVPIREIARQRSGSRQEK